MQKEIVFYYIILVLCLFVVAGMELNAYNNLKLAESIALKPSVKTHTQAKIKNPAKIKIKVKISSNIYITYNPKTHHYKLILDKSVENAEEPGKTFPPVIVFQPLYIYYLTLLSFLFLGSMYINFSYSRPPYLKLNI